MSPAPALCGLVLSGGFSTRMGRDKGGLPWQGSTLALYQARRLAALVPEVFLSCRPEQQTDYAGPFPLLPDTWPSGGPISGLLTALSAHPDRAWLTLPVDMPGISAFALRQLIVQRNSDRIATAYRQPDGVVQPLVAIWEPAALPLLRQAWETRRLSLRRLLEQADAAILEAPIEEDWRNLNTPEDWPAAEAEGSGPLQEP